jgi:hypothetical protein
MSNSHVARTRHGFLRLTKSGQASSNGDGTFAELAHERFCRPRPTAVSGPLDALCQAFADRTLEVSLHAASKAAVDAAFARVTPNKPPGPDVKARKVATDKGMAACAAAVANLVPPAAKNVDAPRPPQKKWRCGPPRRFMLPLVSLHATSRATKMAGVGTHRRERPSHTLDPPWSPRQVQAR